MSVSEAAAEFLRHFQATLDERANQIIDMGLRIRDLEAELTQAREDARVLAAEVEIIRKVIRGSVKRLPDGTFVELPEHAFRRAWWLEAEDATKATDASGALERNKP